MLSVRPLCSTGVTPLPRYYGPLRLPARAAPGYVFPAVRWSLSLPPCRVSQVPRLIFPCALSPTTPEGPLGACPLLPHRCQASSSGRLATSVLRNEAESGSLALRLACLPPQFRPTHCSDSRPFGYMLERAIYMVNSFQFTRSARLILAYQRRLPSRFFLHSFTITKIAHFGQAAPELAQAIKRLRRVLVLFLSRYS